MPPDQTQEAYEQKRKKKVVDQRKKREKSRKAASKSSARTATNSGPTFKKGGEYEPGVRFKQDWDRKTKEEFLKLRGKYHATGTKATKADRVKSIEQMLKDAKSDE